MSRGGSDALPNRSGVSGRSPRPPVMELTDLGERSVFITGQRVGRARRGRHGRGVTRGLRTAGFVALGLLVLTGPVAGVRWLLTSPRFAVPSVEVQGVAGVPADQVRAAAAIAPGANLWRIDPATVTARVEAVPGIRSAEVIRQFPNRVTILVEERRPFTLIHGGRLHWLDEEDRKSVV